MQNWIYIIKNAVLSFILIILSIPALATRQCPPDFAPKHSSFNIFGWLLVLLAVTLAAALLAYAVTRSRGVHFLKRTAIIFLSILGMAFLIVGGLALAVEFFFMQC